MIKHDLTHISVVRAIDFARLEKVPLALNDSLLCKIKYTRNSQSFSVSLIVTSLKWDEINPNKFAGVNGSIHVGVAGCGI